MGISNVLAMVILVHWAR